MATTEDRIEIAISASDKRELKAAADRMGLGLSAWLRMVALAAARKAE